MTHPVISDIQYIDLVWCRVLSIDTCNTSLVGMTVSGSGPYETTKQTTFFHMYGFGWWSISVW